MNVIDLRSDTVTLPTAAMKEAIVNAPLGDDVFGDDPTVKKLEAMSAEMVGTEAAMFAASGTMANLTAILAHCDRGDEIILGDQSHTFCYEGGGMAAVGGIVPHIITNQPDGTLKLDDIKAAIRPDDVHFPKTKLICLENTQNRCFGTPLTAGYTDSVCDLARENSLSVHLDGARIFNAAVALNVGVKKLTHGVDSVAFCLSKGLSAPVGSVICGTGDFIYRARRARKVLGGGMRQSGIIAAAGIVALEKMIDGLAEDHANAKKLAAGIAQIDGLKIDVNRAKTNIIYFAMDTDRLTDDQLVQRLDKRGVRFLTLGKNMFRMVTHCGISSEDIDKTLQELEKTITES